MHAIACCILPLVSAQTHNIVGFVTVGIQVSTATGQQLSKEPINLVYYFVSTFFCLLHINIETNIYYNELLHLKNETL